MKLQDDVIRVESAISDRDAHAAALEDELSSLKALHTSVFPLKEELRGVVDQRNDYERRLRLQMQELQDLRSGLRAGLVSTKEKMSLLLAEIASLAEENRRLKDAVEAAHGHRAHRSPLRAERALAALVPEQTTTALPLLG